jgi:chromate transport protein ChrA
LKEIAAGLLKVGVWRARHHGDHAGGVSGFVVMLALALAYAALGMSPILRGALYGLGPVVLGIFIVALFRLGRTALRALPHRLIAIGAAAAALVGPLGPGVIGVMAVALARMAPHAAPDVLSIVVLGTTVGVLLYWRLAPVKAMLGGPVLGVLRNHVCEVPVLRSVLCVGAWSR